MPRTATHSDVASPVAAGPAPADSPPVRVPARARVTATQRQRRWRAGRALAAARRAGAGWWAFTARPISLRALWRLSAVNRARVPLGSGALTLAWRLSNATDRLVMFALSLAVPTGLAGPWRWLCARPTRRVGFYLLSAITAVLLRQR